MRDQENGLLNGVLVLFAPEQVRIHVGHPEPLRHRAVHAERTAPVPTAPDRTLPRLSPAPPR